VRPPEEFGALLTRLLEARGISLRAWARTVGMGSSFAYKLKAGERVPPAPKIERMADALKLTGADRTAFIDAATWAAIPDHARTWVLAKAR
jgi:transcriptional regulator with XRE-family HTH domain